MIFWRNSYTASLSSTKSSPCREYAVSSFGPRYAWIASTNVLHAISGAYLSSLYSRIRLAGVFSKSFFPSLSRLIHGEYAPSSFSDIFLIAIVGYKLFGQCRSSLPQVFHIIILFSPKDG